MSKPVSPMAIGSFLLGGLGLLIAALLVFGGGQFLKPKIHWVVFFDSSLNGLNVGAPVKVQGVQVGTVKDIVLQMDIKQNRLMKPVVLEIDPGALVSPKGEPLGPALTDAERRRRLKALIDAGLRARLETQSLLTGLLYVDLDFYPNYVPQLTGLNYDDLPEVPSVPTTADEVKATLEEVVRKIRDMPLDAMVKDISATLADIRGIVGSDQTKRSQESLAKALTEADRLLADLHRQLPPLVKEVDLTVKSADRAFRTADQTLKTADRVLGDAGRTMQAAGQTVQEATGLVRDFRSETKPVLDAAGQALRQATAVLEAARSTVENLSDSTAPDSPLQDTLTELRGAARSVRVLGEYLERNPDSLIFGKSR